ncbi:MAG: hypothetical protein K940chlam1_00700 [Candidatus Anoxychlamydiales bacterium]|nr:hypothetical protein [Candidatus Anoxychlamydiales bacterium]NGX35789.1 hypothetical protein [Candidatus Anoxychlamydiales bacterium]
MTYISNIKNNFNTIQNSFLLKRSSDVKEIFEKAFNAIACVGSYFVSKTSFQKSNLEDHGFELGKKNIIEINKATSKKRKYLEYPRTLEHEKALKTVMEGMSSGGYFQIARRAKSLYAAKDRIHFEEKNGEIHGVHPLRQLGYICSKRSLKEMLKIIMNYSGKIAAVKNRYIATMAIVLDEAQKNNQIVPMLKDFVDEISKVEKKTNSEKNKLLNALSKIVKENDKNKWEAFILALFK